MIALSRRQFLSFVMTRIRTSAGTLGRFAIAVGLFSMKRGTFPFTKNSHVIDVLAENVRGDFEQRLCSIDNYWHGYRIPHPVQCNMRGLPAEMVIKIIKDFVSVQGRQPQTEQSYAQWPTTLVW